MRIQFSNEDKKILEERRKTNENGEKILIPDEMEGAVASLTFVISDAKKFNLFIQKFIEDQDLDGDNTSKVIGANLIRLDRRPPIDVEDLIKMKNFLEEIIYGPKQQPDQEDTNETVSISEYEEEDPNYTDEPESVDSIEESDNREESIDYGCIDD